MSRLLTRLRQAAAKRHERRENLLGEALQRAEALRNAQRGQAQPLASPHGPTQPAASSVAQAAARFESRRATMPLGALIVSVLVLVFLAGWAIANWGSGSAKERFSPATAPQYLPVAPAGATPQRAGAQPTLLKLDYRLDAAKPGPATRPR